MLTRLFSSDFIDEFFGKDWVLDSNERRRGVNVPSVNIRETNEAFIIELAAPGMQKEDLKIDLNKNVLSIFSEVNTEDQEGDKFLRREFVYNTFRRSFTLPRYADASKIAAKYENGVLFVTIPKREEAIDRGIREINIL